MVKQRGRAPERGQSKLLNPRLYTAETTQVPCVSKCISAGVTAKVKDICITRRMQMPFKGGWHGLQPQACWKDPVSLD